MVPLPEVIVCEGCGDKDLMDSMAFEAEDEERDVMYTVPLRW